MKVRRNFPEDFRELSQKIFQHVSRKLNRTEFLCEVSKMFMDFSGCDAVALWVREGDKIYRCETCREDPGPFSLDAIPLTRDGRMKTKALSGNHPLAKLCLDVINGRVDRKLVCFSEKGGFWTGDAMQEPCLAGRPARKDQDRNHESGRDRSIVIIPLAAGRENIGLLKLKSGKRNFFGKDDMNFYETVAQALGFSLSNQQTQAALQERVKELTCLYGISQLCEQQGMSIHVILQGIVEHLPGAWQYPEIAYGRIILDGKSYQSPGFTENGQRLSSRITVEGRRRGMVEIVYSEDRITVDEGPFLKEERNLIDTVATQIEMIILRKQAEDEKARLSEQLRHADRLATIGQLAAGVAHELNEPLGSILGFAQIIKKNPALTGQASRDMDKIIKSSLHAREIIKKLMLFGRQAPLQKTRVNLNRLVDEGIFYIESRCAKEGIDLIRVLAPDLPVITADPSQLNQVLVNLVVNAVQAMPGGGKLTVQTGEKSNRVCLIVEDTGVGMSKEQIRQIFIPFYTTKDIGEGTGLGLPVVHGIITSHGGSIKVDSKPGQGTRFEIQLPRN